MVSSADLPVPEADDVLRDGAHRRAIVDAHPRRAWQVLGLVDDHHGQRTLRHDGQVGVVVGGGVHHEAVDPGGQDGGRSVVDGAVGPDRDQQQALPDLLTRLGEAGDEVQGGGVAERVVERFGDHQADGAGAPGAQRPRHRIGARVAEPLGRRQHALAQVGGELVGPVVGVGDRGARHLEFGGQRRQGRPPSRSRASGHAL